jgi:hypothetical protein
MAFFAWGSTDLIGFPATETDSGALRFKVRNCATFRGTAYIKVTLEGDDTYTVKLYKHRNYTKSLRRKVLEGTFEQSDLERIINEVKGVYAEDLVNVIDDLCGEEK